ncbi:MAG: anti-sigma factor [Polaromonas sp.]|nr:anti-sigma factor [Polaromonas sp.]
MTEAELQAYVDHQLTPERQREVEAYLAKRPEEALRMHDYLVHKRELRALFEPVLDEPLPQRLRRAATPRAPWRLQRLAAGIAIAVVCGGAGWGLRGVSAGLSASSLSSDSSFAQRAAVAHAVYSADARRAVEIGADQEDQLVAWLSKRMGTPMKPPHLQALGYTLEGGRLLPGEHGPVAQFMYHDSSGAKLTLYVSNEVTQAHSAANSAAHSASQSGANKEMAFNFAREGAVNVFYWVDGPIGCAISSGADMSELARVSSEVYRQHEAVQ